MIKTNKMKKIIFIALALSLLGFRTTTPISNKKNQQNIKQKFITLGMGIGVINQNKINWYFEGSMDWRYSPGFTFNIPPLNNGLIVFEDAMGVINNNKIDFYVSNHTSRWDIIPNASFQLPTNFKGVIAISSSIGVIIGNKISFYDFDQNEWKLNPDKTFTIPVITSRVITKMNSIGVISGRKIELE